MKRPLSRRKSTLLVVATLLALFIVALILVRKPSPASLALDAKLAQLRTDGVPLTTAEIAKVLPDPDPQHDARIVLRDAFALAAAPPESSSPNLPIMGGAAMPPRDLPIPELMMQAMESRLSNSDALLQSIPDNLDGVWFSMGWTNGFTNTTPVSFVEIRTLMQTLALKTIYEAERGNAAQAAEALNKGLAVTGTLNSDTLVSTMIRVACAGLLCEAAEQTLNRVKLSDNHLTQIDRHINVELIDNFDQTFMVERHMATLAFDAARQGRDAFGILPAKGLLHRLVQLFTRRRPFYRDQDYLLFLNVMDERHAAHKRSGLERIHTIQQLDSRYFTNVNSLVGESVAPSWTKAIQKATETKARLIALKTALAIQRYRLTHADALPDTLATLVPQYLPSVPLDAYDGQPLRFKTRPRGYVLYSVGPDGLDNGGTERPTQNVTNDYDITFTIEK